MNRYILVLMALMLVSAGCATNRTTAGQEEAPSEIANRTYGRNHGWSVPPGQTELTEAQAARENQDGAAASAKDPTGRNRSDSRPARQSDARQHERGSSDLQAGRQEQSEGTSTSARRNRVRPLVPAFPLRSRESVLAELERIHFEFDRWELTEESKAILKRNAAWLKDHPEVAVRIEGHADEIGTPEYNLALGERRARAVREFLLQQGVPPEGMGTLSYGEEVPIAEGHETVSYRINRRVEFSRNDPARVSSLH